MRVLVPVTFPLPADLVLIDDRAAVGVHAADAAVFLAKIRELLEAPLRAACVWLVERFVDPDHAEYISVACGVADALGRPLPADAEAMEQTIGVALNQIGSGLSLAFDDAEHVDADYRAF
jgi:hypothetical protein